MSGMTDEQLAAWQARMEAWKRLHRLSDGQRDTLRRRLKGVVDDETIEKLIQHIERQLARVDFFHGKGPTIDTTTLGKREPVTIQLGLIQKQSAALLQTLNALPGNVRELLNHQWDMRWLDESGDTLIDDPLEDVRTGIEAMIDHIQITLHAHGKPPGAPRKPHLAAKGFGIAFAVCAVGFTLEKGDIGRKIFKITLEVCLEGCPADFAKRLLKQPGIGKHRPRNTRVVRKAKH